LSKQNPNIDPVKLREADAWYWAYANKLQLMGNTFSLKGHEYQVDVIQCDAQKQVAKKGAQMGFSEIGVIKTLHGMIYNRYPMGVLYLFPTKDDVTDFSKGRFQPLIDTNNFIRQYVQNTDAANIKRIGKALLYLRGARASQKIGGVKESATSLKSVPVDRIVFDELDEMSPSMVELARERISHSTIQEEFALSTPTIPDFGVDKLYNESDQRVWMIKCEKCGEYTCLELEFPNCILEKDGRYYRACKKCHAEIHPKDGKWVPLYPGREWVGWWISQLNSVYVDPGKILKLFQDPPNGNLAEVYNSKLGMAYLAAENRLTINDVIALCGRDPMPYKHLGPCCMGVDVGRELHVVIGCKPNMHTIQLVYCGRMSSFNDVHDVAMRHNVKSAVIDLKPEIRKAREFQEAETYEIFLCDYQEERRGGPLWNDNTGVVAVNRTEICDATHELVTTPGKYLLPRYCKEIQEYAVEMSNMAKILDTDEVTGLSTYRYRKLGPDHYRHATNYMLLASENIGIARKKNDIDKHYRTPRTGYGGALDWMAA